MSKTKKGLNARLLSWGAEALLIAITGLLFVLGVLGYLAPHSTLRFLFIVTLLSAIGFASILAFVEALRFAERQMVFVLDENGIIRKRKGWPDLKIAFCEVDTLREELRWLVVYGGSPRRKIAVPKDIADYGAIRSELVEHCRVSVRAQVVPTGAIALLIISILSWSAVLWFRGAGGAIAAGVVALTSLAIGSHRLWVLLHQGPKRLLMWICLGSIWLSAIFLIYIRLVRL